jgi:hypothetical protein
MASYSRRAAGFSLLCLLTLQQFNVNDNVHVNAEVYQGCRLTQMAAKTGDDRLVLDDGPSFGREEIQHSASVKGVNNITISSTAIRHGSRGHGRTSKLDASGFNVAKCVMETEIMSGTMDRGAAPGYGGAGGGRKKESTMLLELQLSPDRPAATFQVQSITDEGSTGRHKYTGFHGNSVRTSGVADDGVGGSTRRSGPTTAANGDDAEFGELNLVADVHGRLAG